METSQTIKALTTALLMFSVKVEKIKKSSDNPFFKSKYAALPDILDAIAIPLQESGLVLTQHPDNEGLTTMLIHADSGEWMRSTGIMHPVKSDPQAIGSAITYQRRYSIGAILNLNIDEDDDGNKASEPSTRKTSEPQKSDDLPWLNEKDPAYPKIVARIKNGEKDVIEKAKKFYKISRETFAKLTAIERIVKTNTVQGAELVETEEVPF